MLSALPAVWMVSSVFRRVCICRATRIRRLLLVRQLCSRRPESFVHPSRTLPPPRIPFHRTSHAALRSVSAVAVVHTHLIRPVTFRLGPSVCPAIHPPSIRPRFFSRELLLLPGALRENTSRPTSKTHEPTFVHGDDRRLQTPRPSFACPAYLLRESRLILLRRLHRWLSSCLTSIPPI